MTSEALMTAVTLLPSARPSWRTASTVIEATSRTPLASSSTLAIASPALILVTRAGIWLRALSCMMKPSPTVIDGIRSSRYRVPARRADPGHARARQAGPGAGNCGALCMIIGVGRPAVTPRLPPQPRRWLGALLGHRVPGPAGRPAVGDVSGHAGKPEPGSHLRRALARLVAFGRVRHPGQAVAAQ